MFEWRPQERAEKREREREGINATHPLFPCHCKCDKFKVRKLNL